MMEDPKIGAAGVISVASNIAPGPLSEMVRLFKDENQSEALTLKAAIAPLFDLVTVKTVEKTPYGDVVCRARNPLAIKTLMSILGMPSGGWRQPLGKRTGNGLYRVLEVARKGQAANPEMFNPVADFFGVDVDERLNNPEYSKGLCYEDY